MGKWENYPAPNLGLLFYKRLYKDIDSKLLDYEEKQILKFKVNEKKSEFNPFFKDLYGFRLKDFKKEILLLGNTRFTLVTVYPGLLVGSGYTHNTKTTGDSSIGFYFDHTTGLPVIPGSSVKGVLRSVFEIDEDEKKLEEFTGAKSVKLLQYLLGEVLKDKPGDDIVSEINKLLTGLDEKKLDEIKKEIFGNKDDEGADVFYDAIVDFEKSQSETLMAGDFITPHIHDGVSYEKSKLKNPTPLQFIKVLPKVGFQFRFQLTDKGISKKIKELLFQKILLTLGIGAKTNVGYGQFCLPGTCHENVSGTYNKNMSSPADPEVVPVLVKKNDEIPGNAVQYLVKGKVFTGKIEKVLDNHYSISFVVGKTLVCKIVRKTDKCEGLEKGQDVKIMINASYNGLGPINCKISAL